jgi:exopolysaccharide production protein ExoZ
LRLRGVSARLSAQGPMLKNVQALRAAAAMAVVLVHVPVLERLLGFEPHLFAFGNAGVDVFFVISGMIMVLTTDRGRPTPAQFALNRVLRIVPLYWAVTLVVFAIARIAPWLLNATPSDLASLLKSLVFVPFRRSDGDWEPVVFVGWTLNFEMAFYLVFAASLALRRRAHGLIAAVGAIAAVAALGPFIPGEGLAGFYARPIILEFALGMLIGAFAERVAAVRLAPHWALAAIAACVVLIVVAPTAWPHADRLLVAGLPGAVIVASAMFLEAKGLAVRARWIELLGDASYAIYLTHFFVTQAATKLAIAARASSGPEAWLLTAATFAAVALVGAMVHLLAERPAHEALRRRVKQSRAPPVAERLAETTDGEPLALPKGVPQSVG